MTEDPTATPSADRYRRVAAAFTALVDDLDGDDWDRPAPCDGWVARDIVVHLVEWIPGFFAGHGAPSAPDPVVDLAGSWRSIDEWVQASLDDEAVAGSTISHEMAGTHRFEDAVMRFVAGDVLVHTWDLARSQGRDVALDPESVANTLAGFAAMGDALAVSGMFGPAIDVGPDADDQTRMIALSGRQP